jgi:hypothetical protein
MQYSGRLFSKDKGATFVEKSPERRERHFQSKPTTYNWETEESDDQSSLGSTTTFFDRL